MATLVHQFSWLADTAFYILLCAQQQYVSPHFTLLSSNFVIEMLNQFSKLTILINEGMLDKGMPFQDCLIQFTYLSFPSHLLQWVDNFDSGPMTLSYHCST